MNGLHKCKHTAAAAGGLRTFVRSRPRIWGASADALLWAWLCTKVVRDSRTCNSLPSFTRPLLASPGAPEAAAVGDVGANGLPGGIKIITLLRHCSNTQATSLDQSLLQTHATRKQKACLVELPNQAGEMHCQRLREECSNPLRQPTSHARNARSLRAVARKQLERFAEWMY